MGNTRIDLDTVASGRIVRFPDGGVVFIKGDSSEDAYLVVTGKVEIREGGRVLEAMARGEIFGEMALIDAEPRSASAVAVGATELVVIDKFAFHALVRKDPDFALAIMRMMAERLRAMLHPRASAGDQMPLVPKLSA
jgi:CRP-like cAMP-binding protein